MAQTAAQRRVVAATSISYIVVVLDTSIVNVALESIADGLQTDLSGLQWVVNAYTLTFASLLLSGGTLGDRWGARRLYMAGLALFTAASAMGGFAGSLAMLTAARILQGVGAAMLVPCSLTLLNHAFHDPKERAAAIAVWAGCGGAALAAGPLAGGLLIGAFGWRSIFLANVPIGLLGLWLTRRVAPDDRGRETRSLDVAGQTAAIVALGFFIAALIEGPTFGWSSPLILAAFGIGALSGAIFLALEARSREPMLPLGFFRNGTFSGASFVAATTTLTTFGLIFVLSLYFQQARGYSPFLTGLAFLPLTAVVTGSNMVSGRMMKAAGASRPVTIGLGFCIAGYLGFLPTNDSTPFWVMALPMIAIGIGGGLITPAVTAALMETVEKQRAGIAAGVLNTARQTGSALGVAIFGALLASFQPISMGLDAVLMTAAAVSLLAAAVWWRNAAWVERELSRPAVVMPPGADDEEIQNARQIPGPAESRRGGPRRQARRHEEK